MRIKGDHVHRCSEQSTVSSQCFLLLMLLYLHYHRDVEDLTVPSENMRLNPVDGGVINWRARSDFCS